MLRHRPRSPQPLPGAARRGAATPWSGLLDWTATGTGEPAPPPEPPPPATSWQTAPDRAAAPRLRVLYIEDNPVNTLLMAAMFDRLPGLVLRCECDPREGLAVALADPPDLLLIDIQMPGLDGYQVLSRLRVDPSTRDVPAIAVSANAMPQDVARGRAAGFADYLTKPLGLQRLTGALQAVLPDWSPEPPTGAGTGH